jgi:hypothetical protein
LTKKICKKYDIFRRLNKNQCKTDKKNGTHTNSNLQARCSLAECHNQTIQLPNNMDKWTIWTNGQVVISKISEETKNT